MALKQAKDNIGHDAHLGGAIVGLLITAALHPDAVSYNWKIFLLVLGLSVLLLIYLWLNPLFLSIPSFFNRPFRARNRQSSLPRHKQETLQVDAILEKIARSGANSLTPEERALLEEASGKLRRRAESKKPESAGPIQERGGDGLVPELRALFVRTGDEAVPAPDLRLLESALPESGLAI